MSTDLLGPTGPNRSHRKPTVYRPVPDAAPTELQRGPAGRYYGRAPEVHPPERTGRTGARPRHPDPPAPGRRPRTPRPRLRAPAPAAFPDYEGYDERPDPMSARSTEDFIELPCQYRHWAGEPSLRDLEYHSGGKLKRSTIQSVLQPSEGRKDRKDAARKEKRGNLVGIASVTSLIQACGGDGDEVQRWGTARRRLAKRLYGGEAVGEAVARLTAEAPRPPPAPVRPGPDSGIRPNTRRSSRCGKAP
ncbi:hypothetical protein J0910_30500 [Nocardiopsis sp. CNT-189]|uniref:hypothetical protein n=1 Tax=Nocardiopsis oceanisediminis TaxID=2816862 RepID=UPI003B2DF000